MSPTTNLALGGLLLAVFLLVTAVLVWQEGKRRSGPSEPTYVVEEAVSFIHQRLPDEVRERLRRDGVRRVVEWEVFYLQGLAQENRRHPVETVAGGIGASVAYIAERIASVHGLTYPEADIRHVLREEAAYLASIGAVGDPVGGDVS